MVYKKLDPEFKAKWVAALRSGRYRQTEGGLRRSTADGRHAFCCLGVGCNVISNRRWRPEPVGDTGTEDNWGDLSFTNDEHFPFLDDDSAAAHLIGMNDDTDLNGKHRNTFADIANWIEANL